MIYDMLVIIADNESIYARDASKFREDLRQYAEQSTSVMVLSANGVLQPVQDSMPAGMISTFPPLSDNRTSGKSDTDVLYWVQEAMQLSELGDEKQVVRVGLYADYDFTAFPTLLNMLLSKIAQAEVIREVEQRRKQLWQQQTQQSKSQSKPKAQPQQQKQQQQHKQSQLQSQEPGTTPSNPGRFAAAFIVILVLIVSLLPLIRGGNAGPGPSESPTNSGGPSQTIQPTNSGGTSQTDEIIQPESNPPASEPIVSPQGFEEDNTGTRYFEDGEYLTGLHRLSRDGREGWFYFDNNGLMVLRWKEATKGNWYYFTPNGMAATGWRFIDADGYLTEKKDAGDYYFFDESGLMQTGWVEDAGKHYYLLPEGNMATGWMKIGKGGAYNSGEAQQWYYFKESGSMATGWLELGPDHYFLREDGSIVTGDKQVVNGQTFSFDENGRFKY